MQERDHDCSRSSHKQKKKAQKNVVDDAIASVKNTVAVVVVFCVCGGDAAQKKQL